MVWMECAFWGLANLCKFSFLCEVDESSLRFRIPKTLDEENVCVINSVPKSTVYKNKWALQIFREWQGQNRSKIFTIEPGGVFKCEDIGLVVQELTESIENMNAKSLNYWLCKFVVNNSGGLYPSRTFFEGNKILFALNIIYFKIIYWCHMIFRESVDIWILYPNL